MNSDFNEKTTYNGQKNKDSQNIHYYSILNIRQIN